MFKNKRTLVILWLVALLLVPIILWIMPGDYFDDGEWILCPSRALFDIECFGCGMTRAVQHMHNFQFEDAVYYNKFVLAVYPGLVFTWCKWTYNAISHLTGFSLFNKKTA